MNHQHYVYKCAFDLQFTDIYPRSVNPDILECTSYYRSHLKCNIILFFNYKGVPQGVEDHA